MRSLLILSLLCAVACASHFDNVDWSKVKRRDLRIPLPFDLDKVIFEDRIVGGEEAIAHSIPSQAALLILTADGLFFCGGSLISTRFVLTAAHCIEGTVQIEVRLGAHNVQESESTQLRLITTRFVRHSGWNPDTLLNDIGVVELPGPIQLNVNIQLIPLPRRSDVGTSFNGVSGRISGWGIQQDGVPELSPVLRFVNVNIISNTACGLRFWNIITDRHICTSGDGERGPCNGDSGGPLFAQGRQVGVASFTAASGCERGFPAGYSRVTAFLDWLDANTDAPIWN